MSLCSNPNLYPVFSEEIIYGYMTHQYKFQKDITFFKAKTYVNENRIYNLQSNADCSIFTAKSKGSYGNTYDCKLVLKNKKIIDFKCDCPSYSRYHSLCKHLIGMMILIERERLRLLEIAKTKLPFGDEIDLKQIFTDHPDCITIGAKLKAILLDLYPNESKAIINTLVLLVDLGIAEEIKKLQIITEFDKSRWREKLEDEYGLSEKVINTCIDLLSQCFSFSYNLNDFEIENGVLKKYIGFESVVYIPPIITKIGEAAFFNREQIKKVIIPYSVTSIEDYAFFKCHSLEDITISDSVKFIGESAFRECSKLKSITIPKNITMIRADAFSECKSLTDIIWYAENYDFQASEDVWHHIDAYDPVYDEDYSESYIDARVFKSCDKLNSITIGENVKYIPASVFTIIYDEEEEIYDFDDCIPFSKINYMGTISSWCKIIGLQVLQSSTTSLYIAGKEVRDELIIPEDVKSIAAYAFHGLRKITSVKIPNSVTNIAEHAFCNCSNLKSVTIGTNVVEIDCDAFSNCPIAEVINKSNLNIQKNSADNGYIGYYALSIRRNGNTEIVNKNGFLFITIDSINYLLGYTVNDSELILPENYNGGKYHIYKKAFHNCTQLIKVIISNNVMSIGSWAFYSCTRLSSITIGNNVSNIGSSAFSGCTELTSVTIGSSVKKIEDCAFIGCYKLIEIINNSSLNIEKGSNDNGMIDSNALSIKKCGNTDIVNKNGYLFITVNNINYLLSYIGSDNALTLPQNYNGKKYQIYEYAFYENSNLKSVIISDQVTSIGHNAFSYCYKLERITIGDSVTNIDSYAFYNCPELIDIFISKSVTNINDSAFASCTKLTNIYYSDNIVSWCKINGLNNLMTRYSTLFIDCKKIEGDLTIPIGVNSISDFAFYCRSDITSVTLPKGVTNIGISSFYDCDKLTSVIIPESVKEIGACAFKGCKNLKKIYFKGTPYLWRNIEKGKEWNADIDEYMVICTNGG